MLLKNGIKNLVCMIKCVPNNHNIGRNENFNIFNGNLNVIYRICYNLYNLVGGSYN